MTAPERRGWDPDVESRVEYVMRTRVEQGLPPKIVDPVVLRQIVDLVAAGKPHQETSGARTAGDPVGRAGSPLRSADLTSTQEVSA